jgi:hypothetical protein
MNISSIGIQLIQTTTGTQSIRPVADAGGDRSSERDPQSAPNPSANPPGVGETVDKTA